MVNSHPRLQKFMKKHHSFLYSLYQEKRGWKNRVTLSKATESQIYLILRLLFCLSAGHIPIRFSHFQALIKSKRRPTLALLKYRFHHLRKGSKTQIRQYVLKFASLYNALFSPLFKK